MNCVRKIHNKLRKIALYGIWVITTILILMTTLIFNGCSKPVYKIQTQEVFIPVKCNLELPPKPQENGSFESHKALAKYYLEIEQIAKDCTQ